MKMNTASSGKDLFWQSWQITNTHTLTPDYPIENCITDFVHLPTRTIIEINYIIQDPLRFQLKLSGWHIERLKIPEMERNVEESVRRISKLLTNRAIYLQ